MVWGSSGLGAQDLVGRLAPLSRHTAVMHLGTALYSIHVDLGARSYPPAPTQTQRFQAKHDILNPKPSTPNPKFSMQTNTLTSQTLSAPSDEATIGAKS